MKMIKGETFSDEPVEIDGRYFFDCIFNRCTLLYSGGDAPTFERCKFENPQFSFIGSAGRTLGFLQGLYHSPFQGQIEKTFENIRERRVEPLINDHGGKNASE